MYKYIYIYMYQYHYYYVYMDCIMCSMDSIIMNVFVLTISRGYARFSNEDPAKSGLESKRTLSVEGDSSQCAVYVLSAALSEFRLRGRSPPADNTVDNDELKCVNNTIATTHGNHINNNIHTKAGLA